jgi:phosphoglycerate dehydrogenase-like enzyme
VKVVLHERYLPYAEGRVPAGLEPAWYSEYEGALAALPGADGFWNDFWKPDQLAALLEAGDRLRWISTQGAGVDRIPLDLLKARGVILTNAAGLHARPMAEHVLAMMLGIARDLPAIIRAQDRRVYDRDLGSGFEIRDARVLVIGLGGIGHAISELARAFGARVVGVRRNPDGEADVVGPDRWRTLLPEMDFVVLALPLTPESRAVIGAAELDAMKPSAWLINVARGGLIDDDALVSRLRAGRIGGAALDAFVAEPLPEDSPYWTLPNVIVSPHISYKSTHFMSRTVDFFLENAENLRSGRPLKNVVDLEAGY